ncbi:hypothetical protein [Trichoplusia ni ascovirus 2c]|uniref:hypothetical protein n=1 Tax=Trichoplusia ni ascovirus 2c TaxID=328615 RepID=UPI0000E44238|nr:hypothetical protein TNAV2c_gp096 [Trichoplusia ni ascovirus 2c]ABF70613.1 hypothetical protein [Trichoplusia ni ascovirus 2c]AUS94202.1 hypothetical protein [Trichoplusia ni ascovirus 6b]
MMSNNNNQHGGVGDEGEYHHHHIIDDVDLAAHNVLSAYEPLSPLNEDSSSNHQVLDHNRRENDANQVFTTQEILEVAVSMENDTIDQRGTSIANHIPVADYYSSFSEQTLEDPVITNENNNKNPTVTTNYCASTSSGEFYTEPAYNIPSSSNMVENNTSSTMHPQMVSIKAKSINSRRRTFAAATSVSKSEAAPLELPRSAKRLKLNKSSSSSTTTYKASTNHLPQQHTMLDANTGIIDESSLLSKENIRNLMNRLTYLESLANSTSFRVHTLENMCTSVKNEMSGLTNVSKLFMNPDGTMKNFDCIGVKKQSKEGYDATPGPEPFKLYRINDDTGKLYKLHRGIPPRFLENATVVCTIPTNERDPRKTRNDIAQLFREKNNQYCQPLLKELNERNGKVNQTPPERALASKAFYAESGLCVMNMTSIKRIKMSEEDMIKLLTSELPTASSALSSNNSKSKQSRKKTITKKGQHQARSNAESDYESNDDEEDDDDWFRSNDKN